MPRNGETPQDPRHALIGCLDSGKTGCLVGRAGAEATYRVYVMLGEVLAAQCDRDDAQLLALLRAAGHVEGERYEALCERVASGAQISELLFDLLPEELLLVLLFERFRENLYQFLAGSTVVEFLPMEAVFVENIQVGHDSRELVTELLGLRERVGALGRQPQMALAPGATPAMTELERSLLAYCSPRIRLGKLMATSPWESTRLLEMVRTMLDEGKLVGIVPAAEAMLPPDEDTAEAPLPPPSPVIELVVAPPPSARAPLAASPIADHYAPSPIADEYDLAAFQDYDTVREAGAFLTDTTLLDRVNLDGAEAAPDTTDTLIEMEDADVDALKSAVSLNFSGPKLHEDEIHRKLEVTNDVLATIAAAIEAAEGRGAGAARMQLLVEGTSVPLAPLFKGVDVSVDGRLPVAQMMKNLRKRPVGEHRRLLNRGLSDLIERALSAADEALDVEGFEAMLEQLAGYQQRLGV